MNVLFVTSEAYPLVKTGGLGDVAGALPVALRARGIDARILLPAYPDAMSRARLSGRSIALGNPLGVGEARLLEGEMPDSGCPLWLLDCQPMYERTGNPYMIYPGCDWPDNFRRFGLLSKVAAMMGASGGLVDWRPDVLHCHDWQTGFVPAYLRAWGAARPPVMFTIHNLHYMGLFGTEILDMIGLPHWMRGIDGLEHHGLVSGLKAGIQYAQAITTVSPTYAAEIRTPEGGMGLDGLLRLRGPAVSGILNGIDPDIWNPLEDPNLAAPIDPADPGPGKYANKMALKRQMGLDLSDDRPLFGLVSRMVEQKGIDLILGAIPRMVEGGAFLAILGSGDRHFEYELNRAAARHPGHVAIHVGYDEHLSHLIQGAADFVLVPSRFEPCGLTQLYALRYGAIPVVRRTGGLADSVVPLDHPDGGTGIVFEHPFTDALEWAVGQAIALYHDKPALEAVRRRGMARDFTWNRSAMEYIRLYESLIARAP
ncbi:glycogen synthase GlgA [Pararhodospirillum oryzae]|uniref:Glycogen synthase n=1 Tax=Pararhodospirillum oryzae TaxID=478448 RepID=A0A512H8I0_9PROT|nr:glycogen synthase GlgA [Pararhodospirillum oryzae]GEO81766.1 glycogen synthase [Pararhodospirillum oryzae]